jgi:signal transduction histidine kinase
MAQPLTILRSALAAAPDSDEARRRHYLAISAEQIERLCGLFESIQDLVISSQNAAECLPFDLSQLLTPLLKDRRAALKAAGVQLSVSIEDGLNPVVGDAARTGQAVLAALDIAVGTASKGEVIEVSVESRSGSAEMVVQNYRAHGKALNSTQRLSLALAVANIQSQRGRLDWADDPFRVSLALPLQ